MAQAPATSNSSEEIQLTINSAEKDDGEDTGTHEVVQLSPSPQGEAGGELASNTPPNHPIPNACGVIPEFLRIEVSDTGDYIPWNGATTLRPGDHIAWLRFLSYYHHAIVVEVKDDNCIEVVEMSRTGNVEKKTPTRTCGCSPLYRVYYPENVLKFSPEKVVQRARTLANPKASSDVKERVDASTNKNGKSWDLCHNNCEHSATWCKVDCRQCGQLQLCCCTLLTYLRRPLMSLVHISLIIIFSELLEEMVTKGDLIGVVLLFCFEVIYLVIVACLIKSDFKKGRNFISNHGLSPVKRMCCAFYKSLLQSLVMVSLAIVFGVGVKTAIEKQCGPWNSRWKGFWVEAGLDLLGGIIGNIAGFFLFFFIPHQAYTCNKVCVFHAHVEKCIFSNDVSVNPRKKSSIASNT